MGLFERLSLVYGGTVGTVVVGRSGFNSLMATSIHALRFLIAILYRFSFRVDVYLHFLPHPSLGMDAKNPVWWLKVWCSVEKDG